MFSWAHGSPTGRAPAFESAATLATTRAAYLLLRAAAGKAPPRHSKVQRLYIQGLIRPTAYVTLYETSPHGEYCAIGAGGHVYAAPAACEILSAMNCASVLAAQVSTAEAEIMRIW